MPSLPNSQWSDYDGDGYGDNSTGMNRILVKDGQRVDTDRVLQQYQRSIEQRYVLWTLMRTTMDTKTVQTCPYTYGNSWVDMMACPDADQDGISDTNDPLPQTPTNSSIDWDVMALRTTHSTNC